MIKVSIVFFIIDILWFGLLSIGLRYCMGMCVCVCGRLFVRFFWKIGWRF